MPIIGRLINAVGTGVGAAAEYNQHRQSRRPRHFTPSASVAGDQEVISAQDPTSQTPGGAPPTYAESVELGSDDRVVATGAVAQGDNKIQYDDDLDGDEDSSELEDDESDVTLGALVDEDEAAWVLDEYAASHEPPSYEDATNVPSEDDLVREILAGQRAHEQELSRGQLPCPVIIPQRRPRNKSRGFVRAYAPVLENVGIDQTTFMKFLYNFHKSTQASPWFTVIEVSSLAAHAAGPAIGFAVEAAIKAATTAGRSLQTAYKSNNFLDRMNDELFRPAGTFAFLMKYKVDHNMTAEDSGLFGVMAANVNLTTNQVVAKYNRDEGQQSVDGLVNKMQMFRIAAGTTQGADDLPTSAPLIFPEIDEEVARTGKETLQTRAADAQTFVQDYLDRRAQIKFSREDPNSSLNMPDEKVKMKSSLADPDHPMFNSGIVGLLTGGYVDLQGMVKDRHAARREARQDRKLARDDRRQERREARHERKVDRSQRKLERGIKKFEKRYNLTPTSSSASVPTAEPREPTTSLASQQAASSASGRRIRRHGRRRRGGGVRGAVSKLMTEDVIYLMIVNLPDTNTAEETEL